MVLAVSIYWPRYISTIPCSKGIETNISAFKHFSWFQCFCAVSSNEQPIRKSLLWLRWLITSPRYFYSLSRDGLEISPLSSGNSDLVYVFQKVHDSLVWLLMFAMCRSSIAQKLLAQSPFIVLMVMDVCLQEMPRSFLRWSKINVPAEQINATAVQKCINLEHFGGFPLSDLHRNNVHTDDVRASVDWSTCYIFFFFSIVIIAMGTFFFNLTPCKTVRCHPLQTFQFLFFEQPLALFAFEISGRHL